MRTSFSSVIGSVLVALGTLEANAQGDAYYINAFRFGQSQLIGSARTLGFAGAQTALGADLGSLSSNPAGLGLYRKSEYAFSPNFTVPTSQSTANGSLELSDNKFVMNMNNMGIAFCGLRDDLVESKWRGGTFALGLTRTSNFQNAYTYQGINNNTSLADYLTLNANQGYNWNNYSSSNVNGILDMAYGAYVFSPVQVGTESNGDPIYSSSQYFNLIPRTNPNVPAPRFQQSESVNEKGGTNEWTAAYGGNYDNVLFFGASLSLVTLRYDRTRSYQEYLMNHLDSVNIMTSIFTDDNLKVRGTGVNLNLGVSVKIGDYIRSGLSFKTPTLMGIKETYNSSLSATYSNLTLAGQPNSASKSTNVQINNYTYSSPFHLNWGLAIFAGKYGFLSGDVEYVDYSTARVSGSNNTAYINANKNIKNAYQGVMNFKVGGELRLDIFRLRAGYALFGSPWKENVQEFDRRVRSTDAQSITLGLGVRTNEFFLDLAYGRTTYDSNYSPYLMSSDTDDLKVKTNNALTNITIGGGVFF